MKDGSEYKPNVRENQIKDGYNPNVKLEELPSYTIALANYLANLPEKEFKILKRIKIKDTV